MLKLLLSLAVLVAVVQTKAFDKKTSEFTFNNVYVEPLPGFKQEPPKGKNSLGGNKGRVSSHIIGGSIATIGQFPWQVMLIMNKTSLCGGSLISTTRVLTAAHCVYGKNFVELYFGRTDMIINNVNYRNTTNFTIHENYNPSTIINDIAVVKFTPAIVLNGTFINLIRLPKLSAVNATLTGILSTVSGWGKTTDTSSSSTKLMFVDGRPIVADSTCNSYFGTRPTTLCISTRDAANNSRSTCNGDSGGPLVAKESDNLWTLYGVVSFGVQNCSQGLYAGFANVPKLLTWIQTNAGVTLRP